MTEPCGAAAVVAPAAAGRRAPAVVRTRAELAHALGDLRAAGRRVALVPTMGALHEGHLALVREAHRNADAVVVSIFVNPLQFGPAEDLARYPRPVEADLAALRAQAVDVAWLPAAATVFPTEPVVRVDPGPMGAVLEGAVRPGHFAGVLTVVLKLLHLVAPDVAVFGQKDAQQLALVRRMAADLDVPTRIVAVPVVREPDGLARSSRNAYLTDRQRTTALALHRALRAGVAAAGAGATGPQVRAAARTVLDAAAGLEPDYCAVVDPDTFAEADDQYDGPAVLVVAARVGTTRLLDNVPITLCP